MKKLLLILFIFISPLVIYADIFDDAPGTGNPIWLYFSYVVENSDGETSSGELKVCASNSMVAISSARSLLMNECGECRIKLAIRGKGQSCSEEGEVVFKQ